MGGVKRPTRKLDLRWHGVLRYIHVSRILITKTSCHLTTTLTPPGSIMFSLVFLLSVVVPRFVNGQIAQTDATCTSEYSWMGNSRGSSPCLVVAELDAQCNYGCTPESAYPRFAKWKADHAHSLEPYGAQ